MYRQEAFTKNAVWKFTRNNGKFLFPVKALSAVFRARFVAGLRKVLPDEPKSFFESLFKNDWVVYAKRPFGGPLQVIEYLGRYTHKIAISNHRLISMDGGTVSFTYKDYRQDGYNKEMTLEATEFIRRFAMHILPKGFVRIRHYGLLSNKIKVSTLEIIRKQLRHQQQPEPMTTEPEKTITTATATSCPCCNKGLMKHLMDFDFRGPPNLQLLKNLLNKNQATT